MKDKGKIEWKKGYNEGDLVTDDMVNVTSEDWQETAEKLRNFTCDKIKDAMMDGFGDRIEYSTVGAMQEFNKQFNETEKDLVLVMLLKARIDTTLDDMSEDPMFHMMAKLSRIAGNLKDRMEKEETTEKVSEES